MSNTLHVVLSTRSRPWIPSARTHLALVILTLPQPPPAAAHWTLRRVCARALASAANGRGSSRDRGVEAAADAGDEARVSEEEESEAGVAEEAMLATVDPALAATLAAEASTRRGGEGDENEDDAEDGADVERARHKQCLALVRAVRVREE